MLVLVILPFVLMGVFCEENRKLAIVYLTFLGAIIVAYIVGVGVAWLELLSGQKSRGRFVGEMSVSHELDGREVMRSEQQLIRRRMGLVKD